MSVIEAGHLTKAFGGKTVVNKVDLTVAKGEIYGFLGRNGAGKSTFINMITGIILPTSGTFRLLGESDLQLVRNRIGVLPDYSQFYDSMTAVDHIKFFGKINGCKLSTTETNAVLDRVGLLEHAKKKVGKFSFGMKKKLGIAQAIAHNPELIFLDEPTSGIDAESGLSIQQLIRDLQEEGKTIFMTSHNLNEVEKICTRIAIMKDGVIINEGTLEELRAHYSSSIEVKIKHSALKNPKSVGQMLKRFATQVSAEEQYTSFTVDSDDKIAAVVKAFTKENIDVYRINVEEPSLEEIFLEESSTKIKGAS
ncbi:ABC transporter ATP-binding protein [Bacillus sp. LL01]|uniref:ABC transporter ATP-binding protein n=1 Tax=Bacillus sp. LL01 TaxID=1665556 RepID=UPI00064D4DA0|nr:ABC transporter ATP-binding protein [Bacillus sp. LL01]KMJ60341.1 ABC transporter ATP-binding protein [Bacillus sp. LL01]